jgi:hypothetical protein
VMLMAFLASARAFRFCHASIPEPARPCQSWSFPAVRRPSRAVRQSSRSRPAALLAPGDSLPVPAPTALPKTSSFGEANEEANGPGVDSGLAASGIDSRPVCCPRLSTRLLSDLSVLPAGHFFAKR